MAQLPAEQLESNLSAIVYSAGTDVGMRREENQDSYGIILGTQYRLFIVADGMGGVQGGAVASNLAISSIEKLLRDQSKCTPADLVKVVHNANSVVHEKGQNDPTLSGMGTTLVSLLFTGSSLTVAHVGDSRAYRIRAGAISRLTEDHTLVQELVRSGAISEEQAEHHPVAHMLTRSIGPSPVLEVDCEVVSGGIEAGDRYLLCSDGLYNMISDREIGEIVRTHSTDDAVQILIDLANERGGTDNITVLIVDAPQWIRHDGIKPEVSSAPTKSEITKSEQSSTLASDIQVSVGKPNGSFKRGGYAETGEVKSSNKQEEEDRDEVFVSETEIHPTAIKDDGVDRIDEVSALEDIHEPEEDTEFQDSYYAPNQSVLAASTWNTRIPLIIGGFLGGLFVAYLFFGGRVAEENSIKVADNSVEQAPTPVLVASDHEESETISPAAIVPDIASSNDQLPTSSVSSPDILREPQAFSVDQARDIQPSQPVLGPSERVAVQKRKQDLLQMVGIVSRKLGNFDKPLSGELAELLKSTTHSAEDTRTKLDQVKTDIDLATRRLGTWYDRRRRLETTDAINLASEVGSVVPVVRQRKEEFERATWDYLKEVEAFHYTPGNAREREAKLAELVKARSDKMKNLSFEVRAAIDRAIADIDNTIADLTLQRSRLETSLETSRNDLEYVRTITGADDTKKQRLRYELQRQLDAAQLELEELKKILPD